MTPLRDVHRTSVRHVPWSYILDHIGPPSQRLQETSSTRQKETFLGVIYRAIWRRPQDDIFQRPKDVCRGRLQDVSRGLPLALHWGPYGTSIGRLLQSVIFRDNFAEWAGSKKKKNSYKLGIPFETIVVALFLGSNNKVLPRVVCY